ncbi:uncharacterized protein PFL1_01850 [Pseudozyma flocculosa PF-1]|uniref:Related to CTF18 - Chromosome Transmission Fidelity factor n=1 Tax=Pseudozyma flocculosa TaxID=84751 RepID=A0A5C3EYP4_9BASI|nr:uncharacterized protein PFL1_01850 [Pseudozyma flocculosa PF-1]EPQ30324.1 hypothetical protein PFL1_01850 [Pseudozyma flocculosa PF-1]SPO37394.1 related to CTF18 - Chromosome Transmission Fidelity factor [Pseudozyma flocculosa]
MAIQLESNGILDGPTTTTTSSLHGSGDGGETTSTLLRQIDSNLPLHAAQSQAASASAAQKALNSLATRPRAFALAPTDEDDAPPPDFDIDEMLRDEEDDRLRRQADDDAEQELLDLIRVQDQDEHEHRRPPRPAPPKSADTGAASHLEDLLGMTASPSRSDGGASARPQTTSQRPTALSGASVQDASTASPSTLSALERIQAEMETEARLVDLPSCAQAGPSSSSSANLDAATGTASSSRRPATDGAAIPKYIPAGFAYATSFDGKEIRFERRKRLKAWKPSPVYSGTRVQDLLAEPIYRLRDRVEALKALEIVERHEAAEAAASASKVGRSTADASGAGAAAAGATARTRSGKLDRTSQMWVDRYRPKKFTELLGDERVHRDVLGWLKEWDECVFKRKNLRKERHRQYIESKYGNGGDRSSSSGVGAASTSGPSLGGVGGVGAADGKPAWKDPYGRPSERVLMVSGPPGLGKTTLAHVIAQHAGYNVFELNASDARTAGAVEDQIRMALESGSLKDPRPTLVVIDEIDGATGGGGGGGGGAGGAGGGGASGSGESAGFVRALVKLIENGRGSSSAKGGAAGGSSRRGHKNGKQGHKPLLRPIICVCNDVYAPALRPLRPLAKLVRFNKAPTNIVVRRLRDICDAEGVEADTRGLSLLCELTGGDIRACINALEFAKTKDVYLTEAAVRNAAVGIKDTGTTVHRVWEMLFRTQNRKEKIKSSTRGQQAAASSSSSIAPWNQQGGRSASAPTAGAGTGAGAKGKVAGNDVVMVDTPQENVNRLIHEIGSCNEYDKLAQGCFEHYPLLRASDDGWRRFRRAHEWLDFGQAVSAKAWSSGGGSFELLAYLPWSFVPWHLLFANSVNPLPEYPRVDYEMHLRATAFREISSTLHASLPPSLRCQFNRTALHLELGPTLLPILNPELRPINNAITSTSDRATLSRLVDIMLSLGLELVQDRSEADPTSLVWKLDPPLEVFNLFQGRSDSSSSSVARGKTRLALRAIVAREMQKQRTRLKHLAAGGCPDESTSTTAAGQTTAGKAMSVYRRGASGGGGAASIQTTGTAAAGLASGGKVAKDFFGRVILPKPSVVAPPAAAVEIPEGMRRGAATTTTMTARRTRQAADEDEDEDGDASSSNKKLRLDASSSTGIKVFYRYHEGFSNAVRRPVKMSFLL